MNKFSYLFFLLIFATSISFGQKKVLNAILTTEKITVDGKIDEKIWENAPIATDFVNYAPDNGKPIPHEKRTEVKIVYDNDAIYVLAKMYDNEPDKILKQLSQRDNSSVSDKFGIYINGYNDGQQDYQFYVSAAGVQADCIATADGNADYNWNAVWDSEAKITDFGWVVEFKIPYAAIRFPSKKNQVWGLNFYREIRRERYEYTWNLIDNNISNEGVQAGILEGINDIKTPTRLFFNPYASYYLTEGETEKPKGELKGGLDIKYGINDAFTLDVILIPDFGQTKYDNVILNLSPFEQQFNENRNFFTEGVDLFNKGNLLYTRRIGGRPSYYPPLIENDSVVETIDQFPATVNLINAFKISGRTNKGLGIGILNAVTDNTTAEIKKTTTEKIVDPDDPTNIEEKITTETRSEVVEPIANYNEIVLDQRISNNSSVSLVNTNVIRDGEFRDANVSALVFDINTKKNTFNATGDFKYSFVNDYGDEEDTQGYNTSLYLAKTSGKIRFGAGLQYVTEDYDSNDMGINFQTHYQAYYGNVSYRILEPTKTFNTINSSLNLYSEFDNQSGKIQAANVNYNLNFQNLKNDWFGLGIGGRPTEIYNFYEPRSYDDSVYLIEPENISGNVYYSSNYNRKFALDFNPSIRFFDQEDRMNYAISLSPRYRFNDHFSLIYDFYFFRQNNNIGWTAFDEFDNTIMARRNVISYENSLEAKYAINNTMNINLSVRYYWSYTTNFEYYTLQSDGTIESNPNYNQNNNINFNDWNFYLYYSWWFAPGSEAIVLYRNNASLYENEYNSDFADNFQNVTDLDNLLHVFSISIRYHLDYNTFRKK